METRAFRNLWHYLSSKTWPWSRTSKWWGSGVKCEWCGSWKVLLNPMLFFHEGLWHHPTPPGSRGTARGGSPKRCGTNLHPHTHVPPTSSQPRWNRQLHHRGEAWVGQPYIQAPAAWEKEHRLRVLALGLNHEFTTNQLCDLWHIWVTSGLLFPPSIYHTCRVVKDRLGIIYSFVQQIQWLLRKNSGAGQRGFEFLEIPGDSDAEPGFGTSVPGRSKDWMSKHLEWCYHGGSQTACTLHFPGDFKN